MTIQSKPESLDKIERKIRQLEIEKVALTKEQDNPTSKNRLAQLEEELATLKKEHSTLEHQWKSEREPLEKIQKIKEKIELANYQFHQAERMGDFARASEIKYGTLVKLEKELTVQQEHIKKAGSTLLKEEVTAQDVATVLSRWTGIPVAKLKTEQSKKILDMQNILQHRVIGQDQAIEKIVQAIHVHQAGLTDPQKPIGSFLFLGPTGVGKTEVAKALAEFLFHDQNRLIRIDMSEYMEKHAVARLIGAPPGYIGHEEGGQLTEAVRRNPYSIILFDEIEKAHPEVFNIFLQILDDGRLTDSQGRTVNFKNCVIIMTSNIGSDIILHAQKIDTSVQREIKKLIHATFKPEFLNRIDEIIYFNMLTPEVIYNIAKNHFKMFEEKLHAKNILLSISDAALKFVAERGFEAEFGARPLKRALQQYIIVPTSQFLLEHPEVKKINIDIQGEKIVIN